VIFDAADCAAARGSMLRPREPDIVWGFSSRFTGHFFPADVISLFRDFQQPGKL